MSFGIVRVQKFTAGSVLGIQVHDQRLKEGVSHTNPDIDWSRVQENYNLHPDDQKGRSFLKVAKDRIAELNLPKAVRKDAVVMAQCLVTSDKPFFDGLTSDQQQQFFKNSYEFLKQRYGAENVISATIHMDEKTPHMHFNFVPVTPDRRLCAKDVLTRKGLIEQQDQFQEKVGQKYGLERGIQGGSKVHLETAEYKAAMARKESQKLQNELRRLQEAKKGLQGKIEGLQGAFASIDKIPHGKKTLTGNYTFTAQERNDLLRTCEGYWAERSKADSAKRDVISLKSEYEKILKSSGAQANQKLRNQLTELRQINNNLAWYKREFDKMQKAIENNPELAKVFEKAIQQQNKELGHINNR